MSLCHDECCSFEVSRKRVVVSLSLGEHPAMSNRHPDQQNTPMPPLRNMPCTGNYQYKRAKLVSPSSSLVCDMDEIFLIPQLSNLPPQPDDGIFVANKPYVHIR
jgi:hypothetical protein